MFLASFLSAFFGLHFQWGMGKVGLKFRGSLISAVYGKILKVSLSSMADGGFSSGELTNFMSTDTDRYESGKRWARIDRTHFQEFVIPF